MSNLSDQLASGALCTLEDVAKRVPGYDPGADNKLDATLNDLILRESADFQEASGREILPMNDDTARTFDITASIIARRSFRIGDVATVTRVELFDVDGATSLGQLQASQYVLLPRARKSWEPFRRIKFPYRPGTVLSLRCGGTIVITGTFGFPEIPTTVRQAIATMVVYRYLSDAAFDGTPFAELANRDEFNMASAIRVAMDARDRLSGPALA
jgi:hypothetical protein